jgi:hypothetical protein
LGKPKAFQVEEDKILAEVTLSTIYRRIPLIKGNHPRTWRESIRREWNAPLFRRYRNINAKDMVERHITPQKKSGIDQRLHRQCHFLRLVTLQEKSGIDQRLYRHDHLFNHWLNRMRDNKVKRRITPKTRGFFHRRLHRHDCWLNKSETTWSRDASPPKRRVGSIEYCIDMTAVSTKEGLEYWETKDDLEPEGLSDKDYASCTTSVVGHK